MGSTRGSFSLAGAARAETEQNIIDQELQADRSVTELQESTHICGIALWLVIFTNTIAPVAAEAVVQLIGFAGNNAKVAQQRSPLDALFPYHPSRQCSVSHLTIGRRRISQALSGRL
ncbi:hypothetical protein FPRO06_01696 [Fusarium proliferatum]|uniref:Uncharacterized protein n=1 Tax=Gibberella intermedia TaxID=948311 RepID=A0A365MRV5_GIBIN|nr:hypothetical protein FPRO03_01705 [Fusarium proliferatum]KAG4279272.1 hypothetical protein FPRO04_05813 [Fusarium proliferatum]KAG4295112.1 hypothetical protein FPRO06_01696 [Fusarium proliferatum]RBA11277.1 hypothetical protein FPRO05_04450 [Fusarium proliferatum]RKL27870.1 hypothetical protein BFJ72_g12778 [Fusarium proliferatum]